MTQTQIDYSDAPNIELIAQSLDLTKQFIDRPVHDVKTCNIEKYDTVQTFRAREFKTTSELIKYAGELYEKCSKKNKSEEVNFLRQLKDYNHTYRFENEVLALSGAIEMYLHFKEIEARLANLVLKIKRNTFLNREFGNNQSELYKRHKNLNSRLSDVESQIANTCIDEVAATNRKAILDKNRKCPDKMTKSDLMNKFHYAPFVNGKPCTLDIANGTLNKFQDQLKEEESSLEFNFPSKYYKIGCFKQQSESKNRRDIFALLIRVKALFEDYFRSYFHWGRHYRLLAETIADRLQGIINSVDPNNLDNPNKLDEAVKLISGEENRMGVGKSLSDKKASSFFRRAHFAVGLLEGRVTLENSKPVKARAL